MNTMFDNADPIRQKANLFEGEHAQHNLLLLVNLVIKVNELISRQHILDKKYSMVLKTLFEIDCDSWKEKTYKLRNALWNTFVHYGGMILLMNNNCASEYEIVQFSSGTFQEKFPTTETRDYILKVIEEKVLRVIDDNNKTHVSSLDGFKFNSVRIFKNLFQQSDITFIDLNELDGLGQRDFAFLKQSLNARFNLWRPSYRCPRNQNVMIRPLEKAIIYSNDIASGLAKQSCRLITKEDHYRLNMRVPQWSAKDVCKWLNRIGFSEFAKNLLKNQVDGDLLLRLTTDELINEIGIQNGILEKRFIRELNNLKQSADYSSIDTTDLNSFLKSISIEYSVYTYPMLIAGVIRDSMRLLTDDQLKNDCGILNGIHRNCIIDSIKEMPACVENKDKPYDAFICYRQSTDSMLASLIKIYLDIEGYSVFLDVQRCPNDAKYRHNVLQTIKQTKNVIIVLTPGSLDKHTMNSSASDIDTSDLFAEEIKTAKQSQCNIIPVLNCNFTWPPTALLPDDMKNLCVYNSIRWVHEYQEACVKKLVTFMNQL
ncbi:hypothetical protein ACI65C_001847 [Semiaphis heraclei]